ncbi:hypothetical protein DFA_09644 [Cavenderia fasciculata]|uniref:EGF-like domain-containing protein n=1 Tax=Cavenderia fasciculata TaxID=261658 RepID=F4Q873_CACFS|nr:uncharacterized protein DFA_09644 [Cavenderia fasciculata]EGG15973.1 hypothetical protein DFA_09644 [Cavenderia fasciculata]|eukprot:XP_004352298.1 hypothetical protein DFA_09644 [Cavenderia fasciculata]
MMKATFNCTTLGMMLVMTFMLLLLSFAPSGSSAYEIDTPELNSVIWFLNQTGSSVSRDPNVFCTTIPETIRCVYNISGRYHVSAMILYISSYVSSGPAVTSNPTLFFPRLTDMVITFASNTHHSTNVSTLDLIQPSSFPVINIISLSNDGTIYQVPPNFGASMQLTTLTIINAANLKSATVSSIFATRVNILNQFYLNVFLFGSTLNTKIASLSVEMGASQDLILTLDSSSLPSLKYLSLTKYDTGSLTVNCFSSTINTILLSGPTTLNLRTPNFDQIFDVYLNGIGATLTPTEISSYPNLKTYRVLNAASYNIPFTSFQSNTKLQDLLILDSGITSLQNMPQLPKSLKSLILMRNNIQGQLPLDIFEKIPLEPNTFTFDITLNQNLSGSISKNFCNYFTYIANTSITSVPDCFHCYNDYQVGFSSSVPLPPNFSCDIRFNALVFPIINGSTIVEGSNFGWVAPQNYTMLVPNSKFLYHKAPAVGTYQKAGFVIGTKYYKEVNLIESTIYFVLNPFSFDASSNRLTISFNFINNQAIHTVVLMSRTVPQMYYPCQLNVFNDSTIECTLDQLKSGTYEVTVSNEFNQMKMDTPSITATNQVTYPLVTSAQLSESSLQLTLYGGFGVNQLNSPTVTLNNTLACQVTSKNQTTIICTISSSSSSSQLPPGQASVQVQVDGFNTNLNNAISIAFPPSIDLKQKCIEDTLNCYGHGQCSDQGICLCDQNYYDNCRYFSMY